MQLELQKPQAFGVTTDPIGLVPIRTTAAQDLWRGLLQWRLWGRLGWLEIKRRYRRTMIGPFWSAISLAVFVLALGSVGSGLWNQQTSTYLPYLAAGMVVWMMISMVLTESTAMLVVGTNLFRQMKVNYSIMAYALVWRNLIVFAHNMTVFLVIALLLSPDVLFSPTLVLLLPGIVLIILNATWVALTLGILCLRFRDLQQLVTTLVQIAMFVTPIFWPAENLSGRIRLLAVDLNPLFHLIDILRSPLLGRVPMLESYLAVLSLTVAGWLFTAFFFHRFRGRIAYWS